MEARTKNALILVLITICIDSIGLGIIIPSLPSLIADATHMSVEASAKYSIPVLIAYAGMQFLFSPLVGNLSDRFGRRPIILMSLLGLGLDYVFMFWAPDLMWLIIGRAISGMFGASFTTAAAYIADISTDETRGQNFGLIGAAFGVGFILGPAIGGLVSEWGLRVPFLVAACFSLLNFIYGLVFLKESLPADQRRKFEWKRANPVGAIIQIRRLAKNKYLFLVTFLVLIANMSVHAVWNYYTMERFGWETKDVGISLAVVGVCFGVIQGALSGKIIKALGEKGAATLGMIILIASLIGIGLIPYGWMMYVMIIPYAFSGIVDPSIRSIVSAQTKSNEQGELQAIFTSMMSIAEIIGPSMMMWIFASTTGAAKNNSIFYGSPFFAGAFFAVIGFFLLRWIFSKKRNFEEVLIEEEMVEEKSIL